MRKAKARTITPAVRDAAVAVYYAVKTLRAGQGPTGRRTARQRVAATIGTLLTAIDKDYPDGTETGCIAGDDVARARGLVPIPSVAHATALRAAGVPVTKVYLGARTLEAWQDYAEPWAALAPEGTPAALLGAGIMDPEIRAALLAAGRLARAPHSGPVRVPA